VTLTKWAAVFTLAWVAGYAFNAAALDTDVSWTRSLYLQKRLIADSMTDGPRILFVGGSGVHYSVDAATVERETRVPSVNFGLHAGLGLNPILQVGLDTVRSGDVVVLMPEYGILADTVGGGWLSAMFAASISRPGMGGFGAMDTSKEIFRAGVVNQMALGKGVFVALFGSVGRGRAVVDARGSTAIFLDGVAAPSIVNGEMSPLNARRLDAFARELRDRGAQLLIAMPWYLIATGDTASVESARGYVAALRRIAPVLCDDAMDLKTDAALFSDTFYHLNPQSRETRSIELAHEIQLALGRTSLSPVAGSSR
jgi:hypothetical protein